MKIVSLNHLKILELHFIINYNPGCEYQVHMKIPGDSH